MKKSFDSIDKAMNFTPGENDIVSTEQIPLVLSEVDTSDDEKDYQYTRGNLYSLIEKGQEALSRIIDLADQSDSPRAYEVAGQLIKSVGDVTDKLIDLQHKMKKLKEETPKGPQNVTNALFVGSTADLQKLLKNNITDSK